MTERTIEIKLTQAELELVFTCLGVVSGIIADRKEMSVQAIHIARELMANPDVGEDLAIMLGDAIPK